MEISDILSNFEDTKIISVSSFGFITGSVARLIDFDKKIEMSRKKVFSENDAIEKKYTKLSISAIASITSANYDGNLASDISQIAGYTVLFRLGYEAGYRVF